MKLKICKPAYEFVIEFARKMNFKNSQLEKYLYFLSLLSRSNEYRNLSSQYMKKSLGKNKQYSYKLIINALTKEGVIECDGKRFYGKKSYGYRLKEKYYCTDKVEYKMTKTRLSNQIQIAALKRFETLPEYIKQQTANLAELTFNGQPVGKRLARRTRTGRISNFLTTNKREVRDYLLYRNNEKLVELDFNAFHPYLLSIIVSTGLGYQSIDELMPDDLRLYLQLAEQGIVYEYFYDLTGNGYENDFERDKFKKGFYSGYFFNRKYNVVNKSKVGKIFKTNFPTVHNYIIDNYINKGRTLANALQVEEADLLINNIYKQLYEENIWSATINDSVVCRKKDKEKVYSLMEDVINQNIIPCFINDVEWKGMCIHPEENADKDYIKEQGDNTRLYNMVTFPKVYTPVVEETKPVNQNEQKKQHTRQIILSAIEQLNAAGQEITALGLHKRTGLNRGTIIKHLKEINHQENPASASDMPLPAASSPGKDDWVQMGDEMVSRKKLEADWKAIQADILSMKKANASQSVKSLSRCY